MNKKCLVICPIGEEGSDARSRSDQVFRFVISPPLESQGYEVFRADRIQTPGVITTQVIKYLIGSELVVADLTGRNPNVFYELAIRHATHKPCIVIIDNIDDLPFDVMPVRAIPVDIGSLESVENAKDSILKQAVASEQSDFVAQSPISTTINLDLMRSSGNPASEILAEIRELLVNIKLDIEEGRSRLLLSGSIVSFNQVENLMKIVREALSEDGTPEFAEKMRRLRKVQIATRTGDDFLQDGKFREAEVMYDRALQADPYDSYALIGKSKALKRRFQRENRLFLLRSSIDILDSLIASDPTLERSFYNRACYKCLYNAAEPGTFSSRSIITDLRLAIKGFGHYREMAREDPDLTPISTTEEFLGLVGQERG